MRSSLLTLAILTTACGSQVDERDTTGAAPTASGPAPAAAEPPVILAELFTSQGCSSCPPADRLLSAIDELATDGAEVVPLAFHVDYWDDLGWKDPFSSAAWTERQQRYAARVSGGRVYTPMLVVQGRAHMVGSSRDEVADALRGAARASGDGAAITGRTTGSGRLAIDATAGASAAGAFFALVESGIDTEVTRGENRGRRLRNDSIVRRLARAVELAPRERKSVTVDLAIDPSWRRDRLAVVLFLQEPESLAIRAVARATGVP